MKFPSNLSSNCLYVKTNKKEERMLKCASMVET